jgi:hypothetical protein
MEAGDSDIGLSADVPSRWLWVRSNVRRHHVTRQVLIYVAIVLATTVAFRYIPDWAINRAIRRQVYPDLCRRNVIVITKAKALWAEQHHKTADDVVTWSDLLGSNGYIRGLQVPRCSGSQYILGRVGERPRCALPEHNTP